MDPADLYRRASHWAAGVFAGVTTDQHPSDTPCAEWNVRELMNHLIGSNRFFAAAAAGTGGVDPNADAGDVVGDDPAASYRASAAALMEAFATPGVYEQTMPTPTGELPGAVLYAIAASEQLIHGWDLARATGQDTTLDPELAAAFDAMIRPNIDGAVAGGFYAPAVEVPADASPGDKLVALVGRRP